MHVGVGVHTHVHTHTHTRTHSLHPETYNMAVHETEVLCVGCFLELRWKNLLDSIIFTVLKKGQKIILLEDRCQHNMASKGQSLPIIRNHTLRCTSYLSIHMYSLRNMCSFQQLLCCYLLGVCVGECLSGCWT